MNNRIRKRQIYSRRKLPRQFVKDTLRALAEEKAGKLTNYKMKKDYGLTLKTRTGPVRPVPMDLSGEAGRRVVMAAVKRVMATHADVLKALAKR